MHLSFKLFVFFIHIMHLFVYILCECMCRSEETTSHRETGKTEHKHWRMSINRTHQPQLMSVFSHFRKKKGKE